MTEAAVVDASPLIILARSDRLDLLLLAAPRIVVPDVVERELRAGADDRTLLPAFARPWLTVTPSPQPSPSLLRWNLGSGETAVLAMAATMPGAIAVIDDLAARRAAAALGLRVRGCLGLVLRAKQQGLIREARPVVDELVGAGLYLSGSVMAKALALVGE